MITAEEFFRQKLKELHPHMDVITLNQLLITAEQGMRWAHEYSLLKAKFHVQEALKQASEKTMIINDRDANKKRVSKKSILKAYPLENIK